jgi:hypothetical protein
MTSVKLLPWIEICDPSRLMIYKTLITSSDSDVTLNSLTNEDNRELVDANRIPKRSNSGRSACRLDA